MSNITLDTPYQAPTVNAVEFQGATIHIEADQSVFLIEASFILDGKSVTVEARDEEVDGKSIAQLKTLIVNKIKAYI